MWLYAPDQLSLVVPMQIESRQGALLVGGELTPAYVIAVDSLTSSGSRFALQAAGLVGARFSETSLGARLQLAWFDTRGDSDGAQLAVVPFVHAQLGRAGFLYARFVLPIDGPVGIAGDRDVIWGLYVGGGGRL
jgi:hypothetical protein